MLLSTGETAKGREVSVCRGCIAAVIEVESLRNQVRKLKADLDAAEPAADPVQIKVLPPPEDDGDQDLNRKAWNKAIKAAAAEAAHAAYDTGDGLNIRIAEAILELKK